MKTLLITLIVFISNTIYSQIPEDAIKFTSTELIFTNKSINENTLNRKYIDTYMYYWESTRTLSLYVKESRYDVLIESVIEKPLYIRMTSVDGIEICCAEGAMIITDYKNKEITILRK